MKPTRRQFVQTAFTGATLLAAGGEALAMAQNNSKNNGPIKASSVNGDSGQWVSVKVSDKTEMKLFVARPKNKGGKEKLPGVIVLQEIFGVNHYIRGVTQRIADLGYVAVAPDLFHRTAPGFEIGYENGQPGMEQMQKMTDSGLEEDLKASYSWLKEDAGVDGSKIGVVDYCMGGRAAFLANAVLPIQAAASYYGGGIAQTLLPRAADQHAPILLFSGGKDTHIGRDNQNKVAVALKAAKKPYVDVEISEAEHGFFCDERSSYNPEAARESWALFSAFFQEHLKGSDS